MSGLDRHGPTNFSEAPRTGSANWRVPEAPTSRHPTIGESCSPGSGIPGTHTFHRRGWSSMVKWTLITHGFPPILRLLYYYKRYYRYYAFTAPTSQAINEDVNTFVATSSISMWRVYFRGDPVTQVRMTLFLFELITCWSPPRPYLCDGYTSVRVRHPSTDDVLVRIN